MREPSRRETLRALGAVIGGTFFPWAGEARNERGERLFAPQAGTAAPARP